VQRILKFAKFLPQFGWQPIVLTVKGGTYSAIDESLLKEVADDCHVYQGRTLEPTVLYKRFVGMKDSERIPIAVLAEPNPSFKKKLANWVRLNLFVPDAKMGWWPGAVLEGSRAIRKERPDLIFSTAPPPTTHLVGKTLARRFRIPWAADFRDPWTDTHYYEGHQRVGIVERLDEALERSVCAAADRLVFVSRLDAEEYAERHAISDKCVHIPNGYDELDFSELPDVEPKRDKFTVAHLGGLGVERNPVNLFRAVRSLVDEGVMDPERICIQLVGNVQESVVASATEAGVGPFLELVPYVPHHEALTYAARAHALLLLITQSRHNMRILPGKTFEYIRYGKPIIALGPPGGEVDRILREVGAGSVMGYGDAMAIKVAVGALYQRWNAGDKLHGAGAAAIEPYTRENLARQLVSVFDDLVHASKQRAQLGAD
jgi:glycosyltransferase involved in cell wall biosynthesis